MTRISVRVEETLGENRQMGALLNLRPQVQLGGGGAAIRTGRIIDLIGKGLTMGEIVEQLTGLEFNSEEQRRLTQEIVRINRDLSVSFGSLEAATAALSKISQEIKNNQDVINEVRENQERIRNIQGLGAPGRVGAVASGLEVVVRQRQTEGDLLALRQEKIQQEVNSLKNLEEFTQTLSRLEERFGIIDGILQKVGVLESQLGQVIEHLNQLPQLEQDAVKQGAVLAEQTDTVRKSLAAVPEEAQVALAATQAQFDSFVDDTRQTSRQFEDIWQRTMGGRGILAGLFGGLLGGSRGGFPSILTGIGLPGFPGGSGGAAILTPPFNPNALAILSPTALAATNFFSGGPVRAEGTVTGGAGEIPGALGGATQGALGTLIFGSGPERIAALRALGLAGANIAGSALLDIAARAGGPVKGALGGVLLGLGVGVTAAGGFGAAFASLAAAGPIGLGLGAVAGLVLGIIGRGRAKRRAAGMEEEFIRQGQEIVDRYKEFENQFGPAIAQLEGLKAQGMDTLLGAGLGRAGHRGAQNLGSNMDVLLREVERIERQREQRRMLLGDFALPEFMFGGPVRGINAANGALLAMLHPGEFVLGKEAVQAMGEAALATLNSSPQTVSGPGFAAPARHITVNFNISAVDGASVARFWRQSRPQIVKAVRKAIGDRAL